jgi:hypothetical protein
MHDRCMVCVEHTIVLEVILDTPDGTPRFHGSCGTWFRSVWRQYQCGCNIGAWFAPNVPWAQKSFWMHPLVLLGDKALVEARFGPFGDCANLDGR